ncbi:MAG: radical SAM/SPASM domain-containing protein [Faecalibacterium sp.]
MKKRFSRVYIEITNICNLSCSFCLGNHRPARFMSTAEFQTILNAVKPYTDYLCLHVLGEPLLHPQLATFLSLAHQAGFRVNITTNGTLLAKQQEMLLFAPALRKVSVSLHSLETSDQTVRATYLRDVVAFANAAADHDVLCELRLWNLGVTDIDNTELFLPLCAQLGLDAKSTQELYHSITQTGGVALKAKLFLGKSNRFAWPSMDAPRTNQPVFCHALRNQVAILCDGTVVPCCLDSKGDIPLGNALETSFSDILESNRSKAIYDGFSRRQPAEELCKRCGYATQF